MNKNILVGVFIFLIVVAGGFFLLNKKKSPTPSPVQNIYPGVSYVSVDPAQVEVSILADKLSAPTRIKITPDSKHLLVSELTGQVLAFDRDGDNWQKTPYPITQIETHFPGFPPEEAGLVGMVFSADFAQNGKLFLLYSFKDQDGKVLNRISVVTLKEEKGQLTASTPHQIFQANVAGNVSHQITDGIGLKVQGKSQLLFAIGEGFTAKNAQDVTKQAGKILMISEDGTNPVGVRPFPTDPKLQAIGLRNAYVLAQAPNSQQVLIGDTGPNKFDRILDVNLFSAKGAKIQPINLGWNGVEADLEKALPDPNLRGSKDMVLMRLPETLTFTGLAFHPGKGVIPESSPAGQSVLMALYGKTGSLANTPGKEIWLGELSGSATASKLTTKPIIVRVPPAEGKMGNPVGLEVDPQTGNFLFGDIVEGRIYQVTVK